MVKPHSQPWITELYKTCCAKPLVRIGSVGLSVSSVDIFKVLSYYPFTLLTSYQEAPPLHKKSRRGGVQRGQSPSDGGMGVSPIAKPWPPS